MYRGFNLKLDRTEFNKARENQIVMFSTDSSIRQAIQKGLEKYLDVRGKLDGTKMQEDWFPTVNAQVFISHSHQDEILAGTLAYLLKKRLGIDSFIDSFVWGYADELLKTIDDKYCLNDDNRTYNYQIRNYSTSHVHMMLSTALTKMIDKAECIVFLNTPNSVISEGIVDRTYSPWIYHEIATTKIIRQNIPERIGKNRGLIKEGQEFAAKSLQIGYEIDFNNFALLDYEILTRWLNTGRTSADTALDWLYENVNLEEKTNSRIFIK